MTLARNGILLGSLGLALLGLAGVWLVAADSTPAVGKPEIPADDWPQWRGVDRSGVSPDSGLNTDWAARPPKLLWTADGLGGGFASVSLAGGVIYTTGNFADGQAVVAIDAAALREAARATAERDVPMDPIIGYGMTDDEQAILRRFFSGRTLTEIPANRAKRQVLLQRLALEFDVGQRYTEREVNEILFVFHPDWSTLRRYLVDEGFLDREHVDDQDWYWRAGGRVTDLPSGGPDQ